MERGAWQAMVHGVTKSWTQLSNWGHVHVISNLSIYPFLPSSYSYKFALYICNYFSLVDRFIYFLDSTCKRFMWYLSLSIWFTPQCDNLYIHPYCCKWHYFALFLTAEYYSIVCIYIVCIYIVCIYIFIHLSVHGHLGCFHDICKWRNQQAINLQNILTAHAAQYQ